MLFEKFVKLHLFNSELRIKDFNYLLQVLKVTHNLMNLLGAKLLVFLIRNLSQSHQCLLKLKFSKK